MKQNRAFCRPKRILIANSWWHEEIIRGITRHAARHGWHVDMQTVLSGQLPERWDGDGIITMLGCDIAKLMQLIRKKKCPTVSLNANFPEIDIPRVTQDDTLTGRLAADHLLARGFSHFAYYSYGFSQTTDDIRRQAFHQALRDKGHSSTHLSWPEARGTGDDSWAERQGMLRETISTLPKPLAVFATNDQAAAEVIEACLTDDISVPDEVAVLGVLDMPLFRESTTVPLSSVTVNHDYSTRLACDLLARLMDGEKAPSKPILIRPTGIAARRSTDTIAAQLPEVRKVIRFMLDHYSEQISVKDFEAASGVCKTLLYDAFRKDTGKTPGAILTRIRLERAQTMLKDTNEKIGAVSQLCGFGDPVNLFRQFKRHLAMSPAEYRRRERSSRLDARG